MARIRTIKPDFFRHLGLFKLEQETGLPIRIAFAGLWTACDREGRFKWEPETLKLDCLPFDNVDFSRVLDALTSRGSIVKYVVDGREYGFVPSFLEHQVVNNREAESKIPVPDVNNIINDLTREPRVNVASVTPLIPAQVEGKGREGKESGTRQRRATTTPTAFEITSELSEWAKASGVDQSILASETEKFLDHWRAKGGSFKDWNAAWRKWMRNARDWAKAPQTQQPPRKAKEFPR